MTANKNILVVGVGSIGERHVRCFQRTGRSAVSIVEINPTLRSEIAGRYGVAQSFDNLERALDGQPDAAVLCTPAHLHIPLAIRCAQRGIHLLIEKPLSTTLERIDELNRIVREKRLAAAVAYVLRCYPALAAMRQAIVEGRFGRPLEVVVVSGQHFPTFRPAYREIYYAHRATGGGAIQDALTHLINAAEWLVGPVTRLAADAAHLALPGVSVEDSVNVLARHGDVLASYTLNQHQAPNEFQLTVVCERATVRFEPHEHRYRWMTEPGGPWHDESFEPFERDHMFVVQAERFLDTLAGAPPVCSIAEGEQTLRVNLAVLAAAESQSWVAV